MDDLKRMVTGIGLMVLATYLAVFGGVMMFGPLFEELGVVLWFISSLFAVPGAYYFLTVLPESDGSDAETKP
jgi:hypothetical protein